MNIIVCSALLLFSVVLALGVDEQAQYNPEYEALVPVENGVRTKRSAALPFLVGVAAGGIFGPILYNRLYGWGRRSRGWSSGPKITFYRGWRPAQSSGWQSDDDSSSSGWEQSSQQSQGWQPAQSQGWQPAQSQGWQSGSGSSSSGSQW